ncbi:MAG: hypothetical protein L0154_02160 [Chloroflexi bacterium]|nr:hypothetical protein [Chloroflexota bacterium]
MKRTFIVVIALLLAIGFLIQLPGDALSQETTGTPQAPPTATLPPPPNSRPTVAPPPPTSLPPTMPPTSLPPTLPPPNPRPDGFPSLTPSSTPIVDGVTPTLPPPEVQGTTQTEPRIQISDDSGNPRPVTTFAEIPLSQDFEDSNYTGEAAPDLTGSTSPYAIGDPDDVFTSVYGQPDQGLSRMAYAYKDSTTNPTTMELVVTFTFSTTEAYTLNGFSVDLKSALLRYSTNDPVEYDDALAYDVLAPDNSILHSDSCIRDTGVPGSCENHTMPGDGIDGVSAVRLRFQGTANHAYRFYMVMIDDFGASLTSLPSTPQPPCTITIVQDAEGDVSQEGLDMLAIADGDGLFMHTAPTINSTTFDKILWNTSSVAVVERIEYLDPAGNVSQIWYRIDIGTGEQAWIAVYLEDILTVSPFASTTISYTATPDPCPSLPTPSEVTFSYDRERAVMYAIAHAYQNEVQPPNGYFVTHRLDQNNVMSGTGEIIDVDTVSYSYMRYQSIDVHNPPDDDPDQATGSAAFISEVIWMGGLPMTRDRNDTDPFGSCVFADLDTGWRHCVNPGLAPTTTAYGGEGTRVWYNHHWIVPYFTRNVVVNPNAPDTHHPDGPAQPLNTIDNADAGYAVPITATDVYVPQAAVTWERLQDYITLENGTFKSGPAAEMIASLVQGTLFDSGVTQIEYGDYAWISSPNNRTHGFIVAGWGNAVECSTVLPNPTVSARTSFTIGNGLYRTREVAQSNGLANAVPYVVDFSWQLQQPIPRPFYCSSYDAPHPPWTHFELYHNWYFYHIPETVEIPVEQIFVDTDQTWGNSDGFYQP